MNDSAFGEPVPDHTSHSDEEGGMGHRDRPSDAASAHTQATHTEPRFGVIDIVEAFTALRHEYRGQAKDGRQLVEQVQAAVQRIDDVAKQTAAYVELHHAGNQEIKQLVRVLVDTDLQLTRVVQAVTQSEKSRQTSEANDREAVEARFQRMNAVSRWFARPLYDLHVQQEARNATNENSLLEGLSLTVSKLQQSMLDLGIERIEVLGKPFDGTTMNAIGTVESTTIAAGYVAEQISPCYRWKSTLLRFADVRVAQPPSK